MPTRILFVEDENIARNNFGGYLKNIGYIPILCKNGQEAIGVIEAKVKFDLAFVDLSLPDENGAEIIRLLKDYNPKAHIYSMSGYDLYDNTISGTDAHLDKPIMESLERILRLFPAN